jgi:hypothetical protein
VPRNARTRPHGHWAYDLALHRNLLTVLEAERAALAAMEILPVSSTGGDCGPPSARLSGPGRWYQHRSGPDLQPLTTEVPMGKAGRFVLPGAQRRNGPPPLSLNQAAAALVAPLNGAQQVPSVEQLRSVVRRACRARIISAKGGRHHG